MSCESWKHDKLHYRVRGWGTGAAHHGGSSGADGRCSVAWRVIFRDRARLARLWARGGEPAICAIEAFADSFGPCGYSTRLGSTIVGFSLGGAVALEMALQRPDAVPGLL